MMNGELTHTGSAAAHHVVFSPASGTGWRSPVTVSRSSFFEVRRIVAHGLGGNYDP